MWVCLQKDNCKRHNKLHLQVHNIPKHIVTKGQLEDEFGPDGYVKKIQFPGWTKEGQSPSYAYVHFHEKQDIRKAITIVNGTDSPFIQLTAIPKDISEHDLRMWFQDCGEIENLRLTGDEMPEYLGTRKAIVIFRTVADANRAVTHLCNFGFGSLPFRINGLVTQTEYQIPPNTVCTRLHEMNCNPSSGRFDEEKHPPAWGTQPSKHPRAPTLHTGQQHAGEIQRQPAPLQAGLNQQQQRQLQQQGNQQPSEPATAPPLHTEQQAIKRQQAPLQAGRNQQQQRQMQQQQGHQQTLQPRSYQLPPAAPSEHVTAPTLHTGQQPAMGIQPLQAGQNQQQQRQLQQQRNQQPQQIRPHQLPPPAPSKPATAPTYRKQQTPTAGAAQQQQQLQIPLHGNQLPPQPVTYEPLPPVQVGPYLQPQQQLAAAFQWQPPPVHRGQYPLALPVFYDAPIPQQQLAPLGRFTLLVRGIPHYFTDTDVLEIFQRYSYSGSLIEAKVQLCTQALTQPHATVTYGLRNDADQAIQNLHMKYLQRSPTNPTPIIFTVEPYDY